MPRRVFFGHQSVGANILEGVRELTRNSDTRSFQIVEGTDAAKLQDGTLMHAFVGTNKDPYSKMRAFRQYLDAGVGRRADVAVLKFCYIDVDETTDVDRLFGDYREMMTDLRGRYPHVRFVHATMPLLTVQTGPKAVIKSLLGLVPYGYVDNGLRNRYNTLLRTEYAGREPIFDIAAVESLRPDGSESRFEFEGQRLAAMHPAYTTDGGHLNDEGRARAAAAFLEAIAAVAD